MKQADSKKIRFLPIKSDVYKRQHYTRFRMLDFVTETDFTRIIREHTELFELLEKKDIAGLERSLKEHLYYSMKRMKHQIDVEYKDYFEQEE